MGLPLKYNEVVTFYKVQSNGYRGTKEVVDSADVEGIFVQATGFSRGSFQENYNADAIYYPNFNNAFIVENANRLEGMYILANVFEGQNDQSWFKVENVSVNRDHLLGNRIDNIECRLKKTTALPGIS